MEKNEHKSFELSILGERFTLLFSKYMPDAFVLALLLTVISALAAFFWVDATPVNIVKSWYGGFFDLLAFAMQIILIVITGYCIALSPVVSKLIDKLASLIKTPTQVYFFVVAFGMLLCLVSFGWIVITCVLARELAKRISGINYPFLVACAYLSINSWVLGLSSSIPLLLNTEGNYLLDAGLIDSVIPTTLTLGSKLNLAMMFFLVIVIPFFVLLLVPKPDPKNELSNLRVNGADESNLSIEKEAQTLCLNYKAPSDMLNNSLIIQSIISFLGLSYIVIHFYENGFSLNFSIMIFMFLVLGMILHKTPMRYVIAMQRSSKNVSGIFIQYPFYAGIMGIMMATGLGQELAILLASIATIDTYPLFAYWGGAIVNFAIPSAGGQFAVMGPSTIEAVKEIASSSPGADVNAMIARASMAIAYGESASNLLQPFFLLMVTPIMASGVKLQARDVMGYLFLPFIFIFIVQSALVVWMPL